MSSGERVRGSQPAEVGPYRIEAPLGEGGMGVVYRAFDTKLNRPVAIKFLSDTLADASARRRFQREAQTASSLNHPHILTVHDVGEWAGRQYIVTELVDGGTLGDWARAERRTWRQVVELLTGIADGLAAAHQAGILHRDIKPGNILVARNGYAKLVDFGLAKLEERPAAGDVTLTETESRTRPGVVLGTIAYMSPEQASGRPLDSRSDIFSFGVILYELLAGRRPFVGRSDLEVLEKVIHGSPGPLPSDLPSSVRLIVEKALEKDPADRYQSARDLVVDLRRAARRQGEPAATAAAPPPGRRLLAPGIAAACVVLAAAAATWRLQRQDYFWRNPLVGARFEKITDWPGTELDASISHDGKFVAFLSDRDGFYDTWVTQVGSGEFRNLTQGRFSTLLHENTRTTGFNADGTQVWLRTSAPGGTPNLLKAPSLSLVPTMGGGIRPFLLPASLNPVWSPDGTRLVFHLGTAGDPILLADPDGRKERQIFVGRPGEHNHYVMWSPDQRFIYFVRGWRGTETDVWRVRTAGGVPERLTHHNSDVAYPVLLDNRMLLYRATAPSGTGWALYGMDVERRIPHQVSLGVEEYQSIAASADGRRLVATVSNPVVSLWTVPIGATPAGESSASRVPVPAAHAKAGRYGPGCLFYLSAKGGLWRWRDGASIELWKGSAGAVAAAPGVSADGSRIALSVQQGGRNTLHVAAADGTSARPLAAGLDLRSAPSWSPDGQWIAVAADAGEGSRIFKVPADGGGPVRLTDKPTFGAVWSPDGESIVFYDGWGGGANFPLVRVRPDGTPLLLPDLRYRGTFEGFHFVPGSNSLIVLQGEFRAQDFWLFDLTTGDRRRLTQLKPGYSVRSFDVSPDGREILFDRVQENSDIVLIDRGRGGVD
jgi:Tol biopolymer transport system component/predicted Ser/Thr protein kinase